AMNLKLNHKYEENTFADSTEISAYAREAVKEMQMAGILSDKGNNLFDPKGTATRAEVSAVLRRFIELVFSSDTI
ncbi:MAG: S-layer homology domain-containing protein, partial [Tepidanaerobacteraceae bacterium]